MKTKLLKKLRKRFQIWEEEEHYRVVDNDSLHWDNTFPYKYLPEKSLEKVKEERRNLILNCLDRKPKIL